MDGYDIVVDAEQEFDVPLPVLDNPDHFPWVLTEDDIPGASLQGKLPHLLKMSELQFWLRCRGISVAGLKVTTGINSAKYTASPNKDFTLKRLYISFMRKETHEVRIQIKKYDPQNQHKVKITFAVCVCKTGLSGTCGHVSAVLHQLIERNKQIDNSFRCEKKIDINDNTQCTSKQNTWKPPKKKSVLPKTCIPDYTFIKTYLCGKNSQQNASKNGITKHSIQTHH
ncbi:unnamed protein product [Mytilus coruscus]|uniref:SWIM-type domain-containing protein n=1 Tax=Mytilus coruscus TaxID=42192 RepID=A0A6J8DRK8_MYTCO|nr:unnamed protein product [Mytilus coruscus]